MRKWNDGNDRRAWRFLVHNSGPRRHTLACSARPSQVRRHIWQWHTNETWIHFMTWVDMSSTLACQTSLPNARFEIFRCLVGGMSTSSRCSSRFHNKYTRIYLCIAICNLHCARLSDQHLIANKRQWENLRSGLQINKNKQNSTWVEIETATLATSQLDDDADAGACDVNYLANYICNSLPFLSLSDLFVLQIVKITPI